MFKKILNFETKTINSAAVILAIASLVSGLLGLFRDRLLAGAFGAGDELDIYYAAFRIPDFISMVLIMGSISAAVIPLFSEYLVKSKKEAWDFFGSLINSFLFFIIILSVLMMIFVPQILHLIVPGFSGEKFDKAVELTRIMFLSPLLLGISNMMSGILRVFKRVLVTSLSPILYNIGIITGIIFFAPVMKLEGLAWGVVLGAFLHFAIQLPVLFKLGFRPGREAGFRHPGVIKAVKLTLPRTLGLAASQINLIVITAIGSTLSSGSVAIFNLANNLQNLPVTFIAASFSTAAFPFLAIYFSEKNRRKLSDEFSSVFRQILFYLIPISLLMFLLRAQIIRVIFGTGRFGWADTQLTAACLGLFCIGIFAYGLSLLISKTFYALQNTKIPALVSLLSIAVNVVLSFVFLSLLKEENIFSLMLTDFLDIEGIAGNIVVGLPLALSVSGIIQLVVLVSLLCRKLGEFKSKETMIFSLKLLLAGFLLAVVSLSARDVAAGFVDMKSFWGVFTQAAISSVLGLMVYAGVASKLKLPEANILKQIFFKKPRHIEDLSRSIE